MAMATQGAWLDDFVAVGLSLPKAQLQDNLNVGSSSGSSSCGEAGNDEGVTSFRLCGPRLAGSGWDVEP